MLAQGGFKSSGVTGSGVSWKADGQVFSPIDVAHWREQAAAQK